MEDTQNSKTCGRCAICSKQMKPKGSGKVTVNADHNHATHTTRALLCWECNIAAATPSWARNPTILRRVADYLDHHNSNV